jgi:hypothetical protein
VNARPTPRALDEAKRLVRSIAGMSGGDWYTLAGELDAWADAERQRNGKLCAALAAVLDILDAALA